MKAAAPFSLVFCLALASCSEPDNGPTTDGKIPTPPPSLNGNGTAGNPKAGGDEKNNGGENGDEKPKVRRIEATPEAVAAVTERAGLKVEILDILKQAESGANPAERMLALEPELEPLFTRHNELEEIAKGEGLTPRLVFELTKLQFPEGEYLETHHEFIKYRSLIRGLGDETLQMMDRLEAIGRGEAPAESGVENLIEKLKTTPQPEGARSRGEQPG